MANNVYMYLNETVCAYPNQTSFLEEQSDLRLQSVVRPFCHDTYTFFGNIQCSS